MTTMKKTWLALLLALPACGDDGKSKHDDTASGERCIPGQAVVCPCTDGQMGAQSCQDDGTFAACVCTPGGGGGDDADADTRPPAVDQGMLREADAAVVGPDAAAVVAPDAAVAEPDAAAPIADVGPVPDADPLAGFRYIAGRRDNVTSNWSELPFAQGMIGLEAGNADCRAAGGDHVCEYTEMRAAEARGEFADIPVGTTAWLQRTTPELLNGVESPPGPGGNCNNWTFTGNHLADGEYMVFGAGGAAYFLDNDTFYDGLPNGPSVQPGLLECGGVTRSVFCCNALP